ncbi:MAG: hypothetical protein GY812_17750 [Actinomycetia bacterium]|nr:hypothetical protein [Actinomycetes bacterium]
MRVLVPVTLEIVCAGARAEVSMDLEMEAQVVSYTPAEPAGLEHAPVAEEVQVEIRLCDDLRVEDIVVLEAGQVFDPDNQQRESVIEQLRGEQDE